jgi:hypothetical protein
VPFISFLKYVFRVSFGNDPFSSVASSLFAQSDHGSLAASPPEISLKI